MLGNSSMVKFRVGRCNVERGLDERRLRLEKKEGNIFIFMFMLMVIDWLILFNDYDELKLRNWG